MDLRSELLPPELDEAQVSQLANLADALDGAVRDAYQENLAEFNRLAGTELQIEEFQGIYGGEDPEEWVRRLLWSNAIRPVPGVSREELVEVVRRAMPGNNYQDYEAYMVIFDVNVPLPNASNLIFYPADYDHRRDWQNAADYDPTPEEIVDQALAAKPVEPVALPPPGQGAA